MRLYKRYTDITPQDEAHLMIDHGLEPVEISEEEMVGIMMSFWEYDGATGELWDPHPEKAVKAIKQLIG